MTESVQIKNFFLPQYEGLVSSFRIYDFKEMDRLSLNPEGHLELIFQLRGSFAQQSVMSNEWVVRPQYFLGGLHNHSFRVKSLESEAKILSVRFTPLGARSFLKDRLNLYKNSLVNLEDLSLPRLDELESDSEEEIFNRLDHFLRSAYQKKDKNVIDMAAAEMITGKGFIPIQTICKKYNISPSYFRTKFNEQIGMSPKGYSKILRINCIHDRLSSDHQMSLGELSHALGYFDQAHFIKDFKSVTGRSPGHYAIS